MPRASADRQSIVTIADLRGGRNGADPPLSLPDNQAVEMLNVDNYEGLLANKRGGATAIAESGGTAFSGGISSLFRWVPGADETAAEFWGVDGAGVVKRMTGGTSWADVTISGHAITNNTQNVVAAGFNGKLYLAYNTSGGDVLRVYDPTLAAPRIRRTGFSTPAAPTVANQGAGTYAATARLYRVRWLQINGSTVERMSPEGASVSFTPNGTSASARITIPAVPSEQETHWRPEISFDSGANWYIITTSVAIGTTTYDDTTTTTSVTALTLSADDGEYANWTSVKYLLTDNNRLLGAGGWASGAKNSRVWFSPVLGATDEGDAERIPNVSGVRQNWVDLNENDGGFITGLGGPIYGAAYAFKYRQCWKLNPTGDDIIPYLPRKLSDVYGCIAHKSIVSAKDAQGNPALYFLDSTGPCRLVIVGGGATVQYLGRDVEDIWSTINLAATTVVAHAVYHSDKHQVWFYIATGSSNDPDTKLVYDVLLGRFTEGDRVRGGWYRHTGNSAGARCSVMMSDTLGATMSRDLKPYIGRASGTVIWKADTSDTDDAGTAFQAYVTTKPLPVAPLGQNVGVGQSVMVAKVGTGVTIQQTLVRDYGLESRTSTALLTAAGSESRVIKKFEASDMSGAGTLQVTLGDASAVASAWSLDALSIPLIGQERR